MRRQQRRAERAKSRVPVRVRRRGDEVPLKGFTRNISRDGMFIQTANPFPPGSQIEIELLYKEQPVALSAVVVHAARVAPHLGGLRASGMGVKTLRPETLRASASGSMEEPLHDADFQASDSEPAEEPASTRDDRVDPSTEVAVFFGSERRLLALRSLSASGAAMVSPKVLPPIPFARLHFRLPGKPDLVIDGIPVRTEEVDDGVLVAMKFHDPPPGAVSQIEDFVARHRLRSQEED